MRSFAKPVTLFDLMQAVTTQIRKVTKAPENRVQWTATPVDQLLETGPRSDFIVIEVPDLSARAEYQDGGGREEVVMSGKLVVHVCVLVGHEFDGGLRVSMQAELTRTWHNMISALTQWDGDGELIEPMSLAGMNAARAVLRKPHGYSVLTSRFNFGVRLKLNA